jgi:ubiquitin
VEVRGRGGGGIVRLYIPKMEKLPVNQTIRNRNVNKQKKSFKEICNNNDKQLNFAAFSDRIDSCKHD